MTDPVKGDRVCVRVRKGSTLRAKLVGDITDIRESVTGTKKYVIEPPWRSATGITIDEHEAEFEVVGNDEVVF